VLCALILISPYSLIPPGLTLMPEQQRHFIRNKTEKTDRSSFLGEWRLRHGTPVGRRTEATQPNSGCKPQKTRGGNGGVMGTPPSVARRVGWGRGGL